LQIDGIGDEFGTSGRYILDARFYRPPNEFDVEETATGLGWKSRDIDLAKITGLVETVGSKPNAITLARAPSSPCTASTRTHQPGMTSWHYDQAHSAITLIHFRGPFGKSSK
jgi:hypothetical protein